MRLGYAGDDAKVGYELTRVETGRAARFTIERDVNALDTVNASGPVWVPNTAASTTTAGVI